MMPSEEEQTIGRIGRLVVEIGRLDDGEAHLTTAERFSELGGLYVKTEQYEDAVRALNSAHERYTELARVIGDKGQADKLRELAISVRKRTAVALEKEAKRRAKKGEHHGASRAWAGAMVMHTEVGQKGWAKWARTRARISNLRAKIRPRK